MAVTKNSDSVLTVTVRSYNSQQLGKRAFNEVDYQLTGGLRETFLSSLFIQASGNQDNEYIVNSFADAFTNGEVTLTDTGELYKQVLGSIKLLEGPQTSRQPTVHREATELLSLLTAGKGQMVSTADVVEEATPLEVSIPSEDFSQQVTGFQKQQWLQMIRKGFAGSPSNIFNFLGEAFNNNKLPIGKYDLRWLQDNVVPSDTQASPVYTGDQPQGVDVTPAMIHEAWLGLPRGANPEQTINALTQPNSSSDHKTLNSFRHTLGLQPGATVGQMITRAENQQANQAK